MAHDHADAGRQPGQVRGPEIASYPLATAEKGELMRYLMCFLLPPVACLMVGRFVQGVLNFLLCLLAIPTFGLMLLPAIMHAWFVVKRADKARMPAAAINVVNNIGGIVRQ